MLLPHRFRRVSRFMGVVSLIFYFVLVISPATDFTRAESGEAVEVPLGPAVSVELTPNSGALTADEFFPLHVVATDQYGTSWDATGQATFIENDQAGFVKDGVYFAGTAGIITLNASVDGVSDIHPSTFTVSVGAPAKIAVTPGYTELAAGGTVDLAAVVHDLDGNAVANQSVAWASDAPSVGTVDSNGFVSAKKLGLATITAAQGAITGTALVAAATPAKAITISMVPGDITISTDTPMKYTVVAKDAYGNEFDVSSTTAFSISGNGGVFAKNVLDPRRVGGPYTVTARYQELTLTTPLTIVGGAVASIVAVPASLEILVGGSVDVDTDLLDADGNVLNRFTSLTSDHPDIATVDGVGVVVAQESGRTVVRIESEGVEITVPVRVSESSDEPSREPSDDQDERGEMIKLELEPDSLILTIDDKTEFTVMATDADGTEWDVTTEAKFATDDPTGEFDGNVYLPGTLGQWEVTAAVQDVETDATVLVQHGSAVKISLTPDSLIIPLGQRTEFVVVGTDRRENNWDATREALFTSTGGGTFSGNFFTATSAGAFIVRSSVNGATDSTSLAVTGAAVLSSPQPPAPAQTPTPAASSIQTPAPEATPEPATETEEQTPPEENVLGEVTTTTTAPSEKVINTNAKSNQNINTNGEVRGAQDEEKKGISPWWNMLWLLLIIPVAYYIVRGRDEKWS